MIITVLVVLAALIGGVFGNELDSTLYHKKQTMPTCESTLSLSPEGCFTAATEIQDVFITEDMDTLDSILNTLCAMDCIVAIVDYYECLGEADLADFFRSAYCGQNDGRNCIALLINGIMRGDVVSIANCALDGNCASSCRDWLQDAADFLGCCTGSLYNNTASPYLMLITPDQFVACNISLPEECPAYVVDSQDVNSGAVLDCVGFTMIAVLAIVTEFTTAILVRMF